MLNSTYAALGLALGAANAVRHGVEGYKTPRPFDESDIGTAVEYAQVVVDRIEGLGGIDWTGKRVLEIGPGSDPESENPNPGETEVWEIYNFTEDAHPIHIHEVFFEVVNRQPIDANTSTAP